MPPRTIQLLVYNSRLFNAHWSIFVPRANDPNIGSVVGGFALEFVRNYDITTDSRPIQRIDLATVPEEHVKDTDGDEEVIDGNANPIDRLEEVIVTVPVPGPSLRPNTAAPDKRIEMRGCQWWTKQAIAALIAAGLFNEEAQTVADNAPVQ
ncbi:uncharacterized protein C8Q71DRAFT_726909 [Rhodofomes roseus]|uniref:Uncharacterized protein n=1 Tax=Rhodofomes roseus TaxID=34475 RepID=A0ABQ8K4K2_9APHY|nr:uncharacterized protein C8Q71DRAFT_726909 [Rhodofomes roseus]KAH9831419.1 hypothetical protein C8Q71DRAFT_726909 [Rhodofomes roseus]